MYQAKLHPEQYSNTFSDEQIKRLHDAIMYVCDTAIEANADSDKFPEHWLMKHRWSKGKKDQAKLPNGAKITFLKVGGRTSAIVPSVQKKTAAVAGDVSENTDEDDDAAEEAKPKKQTKRKATAVKEEAEEVAPAKPKRGRKKAEEVKEEFEEEPEAPVVKKQKTVAKPQGKKNTKKQEPFKEEETSGRRRSGRMTK